MAMNQMKLMNDLRKAQGLFEPYEDHSLVSFGSLPCVFPLVNYLL